MVRKGKVGRSKKASESSSYSDDSDDGDDSESSQGVVKDRKVIAGKTPKASKEEAVKVPFNARVAKKKKSNSKQGKAATNLDEEAAHYSASDDNGDDDVYFKEAKRSPAKEKKTDLVDNLPVDNLAIANHVKFMKQMKGHIPKTEGLSRLFQLISTGPKLVNGEVFSDITTVQSTLDFILGLITDPSATLEQMNNIVSSMDVVTFTCYHGIVYDSNVYCQSNNFERGFTLQLLKQLKETIHLKYCVSAVSSNLFLNCLAKRFRSKTSGSSLDERFVGNVFLKKLMASSSNMFNLFDTNLKCFIKILFVYGHLYYYDELFMQGFWDNKLPQYVNKIGLHSKKENLELIKGTLGTIQKMLENLLENLGNCITYYCWLHSIQTKVTDAPLVDQIANIIDNEIKKSTPISQCYFENTTGNTNEKVGQYIDEIRYMVLHCFGHHKLCKVKIKLLKYYNIKERD
jgi:hypothetical protein